MSLSGHVIRRPVATAMFFLATLFLGGISLARLPVDLLPELAYPKLVVYTPYVSAAPAEVERFVSEPIERVVSTVPGIERVESVSREGLSLVTLRFAWGTDMDFAALAVREKLDGVRSSLPAGQERPAVLRTDPSSEPIMTLSVAGRGGVAELEELADAVLKRRLEQIDGIAQAAVVGGTEREIHVEVDPERLESVRLSVDDVSRAIDAANASASGGSVRRGRGRYALRTLGELESVAMIGDVAIPLHGIGRTSGATGSATGSGPDRAPSGAAPAAIQLRDVATVTDGFRERESITRYNGREAIGLLLFKESGANTVRVTDRVNDVLGQLRREHPGLELDVAASQAAFISDALSNVMQEVVVGGVLAFLVLFLFLRDTRYPVAIALVIPISVVATFALLDSANVSLNIMSLGGLALGVGLLMDNSIVVLENIVRYREQGLSPADAAHQGSEEVQSAIIGSTLTTIAVFGPIIYVRGVAGKLFGALSLAVAFSLLVSIIVALTLLPAMAARWAADTASVGPDSNGGRSASRLKKSAWLTLILDAFDRGFTHLVSWYERAVAYALDHHWRVLTLTVAALLGSLVLGARLDRSVLPRVDQGTFRAGIDLAPGTPLERTVEVAERLEGIVRADPGVDAVFTRVGRAAALGLGAEEASGVNTAALDVRLKDGARTTDVLARLRPALRQFPPGAVTLEAGRTTALGTLLSGNDADVAVRIRGDSSAQALDYASRVVARLATLPALANVRLGTALGQPEILVEVDRERAAAYGMEPRVVTDAVGGYMRGVKTQTDFADFDRKVPIIVRLPEEARRSLSSLSLLRADGVPLKELVHTRETVGPAELRRVDQSRVIAVYADVARGDVSGAVDATRSALASLPLPHGLRVDVGGENEEMHRAFASVAFACTVALLLAYMILAAEFESVLQPFIILLSVPFAVIGAVLALWIAGAGLNAVSLIGMVVLIGIVDNDAVVKVTFINQMRAAGLGVREAIVAAGRARIRPIIINSVTAMLGVLPMALGIGPGGALQAPLAIAVFGGLLSSTALTLVVIPVVYSLVESARVRGRGAVREAVAGEADMRTAALPAAGD